MMLRRSRQERIAIGLWLVLGFVAWNALYDLLLTRSVKDYLFQQALYLGGRGPGLELRQTMDVAVRDAIWISTLWASILVLAGMATIRMMRSRAA